MAWIGKLLGFLLAICLALSVEAWILNQTTWNAAYLTAQMHETDVADKLVTVLPEMAVQITGESEETRLAMKEVLTSEYIQTQLDGLTVQTLNYLHGNAPKPVLDLRELEPQILNAGLPIPSKLQGIIQTPTALTMGELDGTLRGFAMRNAQAIWVGPLVCLLLVGLIFFLTGHRRWSTLAGSMLTATLILGVIGALSYAPPQLIASAIETSPGKLLSPVVKPFASHIAQDQARTLWIAAAVALGLALVLFIVHLFVKTFSRHHKKPKA